jgi:hypothetical protein
LAALVSSSAFSSADSFPSLLLTESADDNWPGEDPQDGNAAIAIARYCAAAPTAATEPSVVDPLFPTSTFSSSLQARAPPSA